MALLEIVRSSTLTLMTPGSCCMCGLPVRDHTKHLCLEKTKKLVSPKSPVITPVVTPIITPVITPVIAPVITPVITPPYDNQVHAPLKTTPSPPLKPPTDEIPRTIAPSGVVKQSEVHPRAALVTGDATSAGVTTTDTPDVADAEVTPDVQLWLNTLSRAPSKTKPKSEVGLTALPVVVKTVGEHSPAPQPVEPPDREHKQATGDVSTEKMLSKLSDRQILLKERLNVVAKRLIRYKTSQLMKHIVAQLDLFDQHAIQTQVEHKQQLPCQHKLEYRPTFQPPSFEPPMDGHAFSTMEKLRVSVGEEMLQETSTLLSHYDDENTDTSSDEEDLQAISEQSMDRTELSVIEQRWEQERAQIAAQWTWIRGQYEDLQHRMRRESDLLQVIRDKKDKVVLLHNDHYLNDHVSDKFAHHPAMVPPLNGYHNHLMMKNNFKFDMSRTGQEMYLKSNQHKRMNKNSKIDGNTCARTRPLACTIRRNVVYAKSNQKCIVQRNVVLRSGSLGKQCCRKTALYSSDNVRQDSAYHPVLSRRTETHLNVHLTPLLSGVDYFPSPDRKYHAPQPERVESPKEKPAPSTTPLITPPSVLQTFTFADLSLTATPEAMPKKRAAATVEHMLKKSRPLTGSQPGSRTTSPVHMDKRKKPNQFDIHNIEVDFSVVAPARIEKPRYKEIEIPKFRLITDELLNELVITEKPTDEDDSLGAYEALHSRCEQLEKVRFINMQINATGGMRGNNEHVSQHPSTMSPLTRSPRSNVGLPPSDKSSISIVNCKGIDSDSKTENSPKNERTRVSAQRRSDNKHVSYLEDEIRRTRGSKHTSDYPTAVS